MRKALVFTVILAALGAVGCGKEEEEGKQPAPEPVGGPVLAGTVWIVDSVGGEAVSAAAEITLRFAREGVVSGNAGCNSFHGDFDLAGDHLSFGPLASTRRACSQDVMDQESRFLGALGRTERVEIEKGRTLVLHGAGEEKPIRLHRAPEPALGDKPSVTGTVIYTGSPPLRVPEEGAQLTVKLLDVSDPEKGAALLSRTVRTVRTSPPYPYRVVYAAESIGEGASYAVEAEIEIGGQVRYRSPSPVPVLTGGAPKENVEIRVQPVTG